MTLPGAAWGLERRFVSFDGTPIFYRYLPASSARRASVLIVHGMAEHGGRYGRLAEYLSGLGCEVRAIDLRGFGRSGGRRAFVGSFTDYQRDLEALHALASSEDPGLPLVLIGHSMGGLISASYLAERRSSHACAGLVLSSPSFGIAVPVPPWRKAVAGLASIAAPAYAQDTRIDARQLTHDEAILSEYAADPLIHQRITARLFTEISSWMARRRSIAARLRLPVLVLQSGQDRIVSSSDSERFFGELVSARKEWQLYPDLFHEILQETTRSGIFSRIGAWILSLERGTD